MKFQVTVGTLLLWSIAALARAEESTPPRIAWYGTVESGLAEAARSGRPILLVAGAPPLSRRIRHLVTLGAEVTRDSARYRLNS